MSEIKRIIDAVNLGETKVVGAGVAALLSNLDFGDANSESIVSSTIQIHPLGFLCLRWDVDPYQSLRVHIWDKSFGCVQSPNWPIHDHIFSFRSVVLLGAVQNKTYRMSGAAGRLWNIFEVFYERGTSTLLWNGTRTAVEQEDKQLQTQGSYYDVKAGMLHRSVLRSSFAITVLAATKNSEGSARPRVVGGNSTHPLSFNRDIIEEPNTDVLIGKALNLISSIYGSGTT